MIISCDQCGKPSDKPAGHVNRSRKRGDRVFCSKACASEARKRNKSGAQLRAEKRAYDKARRNGPKRAQLLSDKREYHKRTYNPDVARVKRAERMPYHVEYCRRSEYRVKKAGYDILRRAKKEFGEFADVALLLRDLESEIGNRMSRYEIMLANGTLNKALKRRRNDENPLSL